MIMENICKDFPISDREYEMLEKEFGELCEYQAWQLIRKNSRNNHTHGQEDIAQDMRIALLRAGSYYKRQVYIQECFRICWKQTKDRFIRRQLICLFRLWKNKTRHGAGKQKFGPHQEKIIETLHRQLPKKNRVDKNAPLVLGPSFSTYSKSITWNELKALGKKITREKSIRSGMVSLSSFDYLGAEDE